MLNEILNAKRPVTETMALYFEAALGIEAEMLTNMQTRYNMQTARKDSKLTARLQQIRKLAAILWKNYDSGFLDRRNESQTSERMNIKDQK